MNPNYSQHCSVAGMPASYVDPFIAPHTWPFHYWQGGHGVTCTKLCVRAEVARLLFNCNWGVILLLGQEFLIMNPDQQPSSGTFQVLWVTCLPEMVSRLWGLTWNQQCMLWPFRELKAAAIMWNSKQAKKWLCNLIVLHSTWGNPIYSCGARKTVLKKIFLSFKRSGRVKEKVHKALNL